MKSYVNLLYYIGHYSKETTSSMLLEESLNNR